MAKVVSLGYTDTAIEGVSSLEYPRGLLNFGADFRVKAVNNGKEVVVTNLTSPVDRPENIRLSYSEVANVYTGTGVDPSLFAPTKRGVSLLLQVTEIWAVTDDADADFRIDLPVSAHLVVKFPSSEYVTAARIEALVGRLLSGLYDTGVETTTRLAAILRGSLTPTEL